MLGISYSTKHSSPPLPRVGTYNEKDKTFTATYMELNDVWDTRENHKKEFLMWFCSVSSFTKSVVLELLLLN